MSAYQVSGSAARLDRLPILPFHRRLLFLVGAGLFFDAFDIYLANSVLGALVQSGWSTLDLNAVFLSATSIGMLAGSVMAGIFGDRYGRKFSYQFNLALFGLASLGCAIAPSMNWLIAARFLCGVGLGAELVIGYGLLSEFVPPSHRGRWAALLSCMAQFGLFASTLMSWLLIPTFGWRAMFVIAGIGALIVFVARKVIPESPRWLESNGRVEEAQKIVSARIGSAGSADHRGDLVGPRDTWTKSGIHWGRAGGADATGRSLKSSRFGQGRSRDRRALGLNMKTPVGLMACGCCDHGPGKTPSADRSCGQLRNLGAGNRRGRLHRQDREEWATSTVSAQTAREFTPQADPARFETATDAKLSPKHVVSAPMLGTFYRASSPNDVPFVQIGDAVKSVQVLGLIEAMKTLSPIEADKDGVVTGILVEDGSSVEFGQALFALE